MNPIESARNATTALRENPKKELRKYNAYAHDAYKMTGDFLWYRNVRNSHELKQFTDAELRENFKHVAIILDKNRTFAKIRGIKPEEAHKRGAKKVESLLNAFSKLPIETVSLWGFSVSNWSRQPAEREQIFEAMYQTLDRLQNDLVKKRIRFRHAGWKEEHEAKVGNIDGSVEKKMTQLPQRLLDKIAEVEEATKRFKRQNLVLLADYDLSYEDAQLKRKYSDKPLLPGEEKLLQENANVMEFSDGFGLKPADLVIRTGEDESEGMHMSAFGRIGMGTKTIWRGAKEELPALRRKTIARLMNEKMHATLNNGK